MGETKSNFIMRINEHLKKNPYSNMFKHLPESRISNSVCDKGCFSVTDWETTEYQLSIDYEGGNAY